MTTFIGSRQQKRLEGVILSKDLREVLDVALTLATPAELPSSVGGSVELGDGSAAKTFEEEISCCCQTVPFEDARKILSDWKKEYDLLCGEQISEPQSLPIPVVRAMDAVLDTNGRAKLEEALRNSLLAYTPPPPEEYGPEKEKFHKRMERLRLKNEETKYSGLTSNLNLVGPPDDITTRSMTYAASIGLNMIVAPLSFGCFMYFFAGGIFDYFWKTEDHASRTSGSDIKRVIVGVISGVGMLFVEMILFVIRTHEMDEALRKKAKKKKPLGPFGYYSSNTNKTFQE